MPGLMKRLLLGRPLHTAEAHHQRLANPVALAVFSSDALSSVAYATEEILLVLVLAGAGALALSLPIAVAISVLLVIVAVSYRQTIKAYPGGGGAYIVARENLGENPGLVAGASLLVDYILTVAVSISAGTAAITSAFPQLAEYTVPIAVGLTVLLAIANLRGVKESGAVFAGPTFFFVAILGLLIVTGLYRYLTGGTIPVPAHAPETAVSSLGLFLILRAFASGCAAMTGIEAIANGVQAFRQPEADNARTTLTWMAGILLFLFVGTTLLARLSGVAPAEGTGETVVSQLARGVFGGGPMYYLMQAATALILVLAANTAYADFPRLGSFIAADGYLPKQLMDRGYRLVYSNGIILLTAVAIGLLIAFSGDTHRLIPLYAVGVFTSFTLSQSGMVVHWLKEKSEGWTRAAAVNAFGALCTFVVLIVIATAKFTQGAWAVMVLVPLIVAYFKWVRTHYDDVRRRLEVSDEERAALNWRSVPKMHNHVVLLVGGIDRRLIRAIQYAKSLKADKLEALHVDITGEGAERTRVEWDQAQFGFRLTCIESPYREIIEPIEQYVRNIPRPTPDHVVTVIIPEFVPDNVIDNVMHNQTAFWIKSALFDEPGVIVVDVPFRLSGEHADEDRAIPPGPM